MRFVVLALALLCGCPPTPVPPNPPPAPTDMPTCPAGTQVRTDDVCDGYFTVEGLACVKCPTAAGCYHQEVAVYCTLVGCAGDPRCRFVPNPPAIDPDAPQSKRVKPRFKKQ